MKVHEYNEMMAYMLRPRQKFAIGGGVIEGEDLGSREGFDEPELNPTRRQKNPVRTDISVEKQKIADDVLEELIRDGKTTFEKVKEVIQEIIKKGMSKTTARTGLMNSKYYSQFKFLGKGATLDQEILESDWFKRNYPNAKTLEEALTVPRTVGKVNRFTNVGAKKGTITRPMTVLRKEYQKAKERGFPLSQKELADEIGIPKQTLRDYISYAQTSVEPTDPKEISRVKRAKEFFKLLQDSGITFTGGGQRYGSVPLRFIAKPEQIANLKKTYYEDFLQAFTPEQKKLLDNTVRSTYDDMIKSGNLMEKFKFAKLLNTKVGFGSYNAMVRAIDRVLSKKEIKAFPETEFLSGGQRLIKIRESRKKAGDDANKIRISQDKFVDVMRSEFKKLSDKDLLKLIKNTPQLLNQVTLRFDKKTGEFFNQNIDDLDANTIRMRSQPNVEHIKKIAEAGQQADWPYNRQLAVRNINGHIKESVEGFINDKEPLLKRKDIPIETKEKIKNQILNIENKMNEMNLRMFANNTYRGVPEGLPAIDRETGQLPSFFENVKSMGLNPETYSAKIPSRFKPIAISLGLTGGLITAAAANTESPQQASELLGQMPQGSPAQINSVDEGFTTTEKLLAGTTAGAAYAARKPILKTLGAIARPFGFPSVSAGFSLSNIFDYEKPEDASMLDRLNPMNYKIQDDPDLKMAGADLLLPELLKTTAPRGSGILSILGRAAMNPFGRAARFFTPAGAVIGTAGIAKDYYDFARDEIEKVRAMSPEERQAYNESLMDEGGMIDISREGFDEGGPSDPSKRKFIKIMGGLASLPIVGKFFRIGEQVAPLATEVKEMAQGMPEWFGALVDKVVRKGVDATKRFATKDREEVYEQFIGEQEGVRVYKDLTNGEIRVKYFSPDNMGGDSIDLIYTPRQITEEGVIPAQFRAVELEPRGVRTGPDDYDVEFDGENVADTVEDLLSDTSRLEEFATGKPINPNKEKIARDKRRKVEAMNKSTLEQAEYLEQKYGPGPEGPDDY